MANLEKQVDMPHRTCTEPDCQRRAHSRGMCSTHYRAVLQQEITEPCASPGCQQLRSVGCKGWCQMHYGRWKVSGNTGGPDPVKKPRGSGHLHPSGYLILTRHGHPLARSNGHLPVHRLVLFDAIGPGVHPCHWCGVDTSWESGELTADHLDWDKLNNDPSNLVPSCLACNARRRGTVPAGETHVMAKLTADQVAEIRAITGMTHKAIAARYNVSPASIQHIRKRRSWKHVP
jgi:hypothetical protein